MSDGLDERLGEIFRAVFELSDDVDVRNVRQVTSTEWDSLGHVSLVTALESEFEIEISAMDSIDITSYEAAKLVVGDRMAAGR